MGPFVDGIPIRGGSTGNLPIEKELFLKILKKIEKALRSSEKKGQGKSSGEWLGLKMRL